jgi:ABC-type sugar transport system permease subunit
MSIMRGAGRWFLSLFVAMMITAWISLGVIQATALNRNAVQGWLRDGGVYQNILNPIRLQDTGQALITKTELERALKATFPPAYLQQQSEIVLNATYDWIEGKTSAITFSIPIEQKRAEYSANLAKEIEPKLAALPQCKTRINPDVNNPTCIPQGINATELSKQVSKLGDGGDFLNKPLTAEALSPLNTAGQRTLPTSWIPAAVANLKWLMVVLPIGVLVCAAGFVLLSESKLKGLSVISRRVFLNGALLTIAGVLLWVYGKNFSVGNFITDTNVSSLMDAFVRQIVPAMGRALTFTAGAVALISGISWVTAMFLKRRQQPSTATLEHPHHLPKPPAAAQLPPADSPPTKPSPPSAV